MKNLYTYLAIIMAIYLLLMPLIATKGNESVAVMVPLYEEKSENTPPTFKVKNTDTGEIAEVEVKDYIFSVVAAEMPALYHEEALKAQAVAAYTFALYRSGENKDKDYDITMQNTSDQAFISRDAAREKWGEDADEYENKIDSAVAAVENQKITYDNKIILAAYTAISAGRTESAENVWGSALSYLVPVESIGDLLCPDYLSSASFTVEQIKEKLCVPNKIESEYTSWFNEPVLSDSGTVKSMDFGGVSLSGAQIRDALSLKSANFDVSFSDDTFYFSVRGYGHLCGMSQYGANYMAMQGSTYKEILEWYYTGCSVTGE